MAAFSWAQGWLVHPIRVNPFLRAVFSLSLPASSLPSSWPVSRGPRGSLELLRVCDVGRADGLSSGFMSQKYRSQGA